jgi:hypothetical protein
VLHPSPVRFGTKAKLAAQILFRKRRSSGASRQKHPRTDSMQRA